jgi:type IV pilus assembly protein PilY1
MARIPIRSLFCKALFVLKTGTETPTVKHSSISDHWRLSSLLVGLLVGLVAGGDTSFAATPTAIPISLVPLTVAIPAHPQVVIAVGNSESMDGNLNGAILTGSGSLGSLVSELLATSSQANFQVPAGFSPPVSGGAVGSMQPYTVQVSGNQTDNSPSRMNMAKIGLMTVITNFAANTDFALIDYSTSQQFAVPTWVYYMSPVGQNFSVVDTVPALPARAVANPCYQVPNTSDAISTACQAMSGFGTGQIANFTSRKYLLIGASSDDTAINDVLYDTQGKVGPMCVAYSGPSPATPFPPNYSLLAYETSNPAVRETYGQSLGGPGACATQTGPTNAGYVPYSQQVMYVKRGFSYWTESEFPTTGALVQGMLTSGAVPDFTPVNLCPTSSTTCGTVPQMIASFAKWLAPETNNAGTPEIKSASTQAPTAGLLAKALNYFATATLPSTNGCAPTRYVVLVTDGLPTLDLANHAWPPLGAASASPPPNGYGVSATWNTDGSLATTNDQALQDTITNLLALKAAGIKTYIIGLGAGVTDGGNPQAQAALTAMAIAGGTGQFFPATDPTTLSNDMQVILAAIQAGTQSTATAAVNSTSIHAGSVVYQGQFSTGDSAQDWSGNLFAFPVDPATGAVNTSPSAALWNAQTLLDAKNPSTRVIATWDPTTSAGIPFEWTSGTPAHGIASSTLLGQQLSANALDTSGSDALSFLRGVQSFSASNGGQYRPRAQLLGDIVDSAPLYVGGASGNFTTTSYASFANSVATRPAVVYVGANDGMLHAFSALTGAELFAYIPHGVYSNLESLTERNYASVHKFFVDGSPVAGDVNFGSSWHTVLVGGEAAGGNSIYAIDVTAPQTLTTEALLSSAVLWDFTDGNMGNTYSRPAIVNANEGALVLFGNGYNSPTQKPFFYALNAQTGTVVGKIDLCAQVASAYCNLTIANGLSSVTAVSLNGDLSSNATLVYAGDLQGNVWRIDISNVNPTLWTVTVLFQARNPTTGGLQPITVAPAVTLNPNYPRFVGQMVFLGTGQMLGIPDLATTTTQSVYGIYDNNSVPSTPILRAGLVQQTLTAATITLTAGGTLAGRTDSANTVNLLQKSGWYVDLSLAAGERVVSDPQVDSGAVVVTSVQPAGTTCTGGDYSWLNLFNYATGGAFASAPLTLTSQIIEGISLGETYAAAPRVEIDANGPVSREIMVTESGTGLATSLNGTVPIQGFDMYGRSLHRTAWTELH